MSNPLFMNDLEEMKFGIVEGLQVFEAHTGLQNALGSKDRFLEMMRIIRNCVMHFESEHMLDTYVVCFSNHDPGDTDGKLSMWRAYGSNGNGAALVFDTSKIDEIEDTPFILAEVHYGTREERIERLSHYANQAAKVISDLNVPNEMLVYPAYALFERIKMFSLFSKHKGFKEEDEWRFVYFKDKDKLKFLDKAMWYHSGARGIEPKLKFCFDDLRDLASEDFSMEKILHSILLGPTISAPLSVRSFLRMLDLIARGDLKDRVFPSQIPLRPSL